MRNRSFYANLNHADVLQSTRSMKEPTAKCRFASTLKVHILPPYR